MEQAVRAQFGDLSRTFGTLRRRRNELEYVVRAGDQTEPAEASKAIADAATIARAAEQLLPNLGRF